MNPFEHNRSNFDMIIFLMIILFMGILFSNDSLLTTDGDYNNLYLNNSGVIKLNRGKGVVISHIVKKDSVIMLSRKSVDGEIGTLVVHEIIPNEKFIIHSVSNGEETVDDNGEIFYNCV